MGILGARLPDQGNPSVSSKPACQGRQNFGRGSDLLMNNRIVVVRHGPRGPTINRFVGVLVSVRLQSITEGRALGHREAGPAAPDR